jgi:hypothetical protein
VPAAYAASSRVNEGSKCRMAFPWQFSPYLPKYPDRLEPTHVRHEDIDDHQIERTLVQRGEPALAAIRDRDPEPALLEPYAYGKAGVQVVIDHQDATHDHLLVARMRSMRFIGRLQIWDDLPHDRVGRFCLANQCATAFLPQITRLSALHSV